MHIELREVPIRDLVEGFSDGGEEGVVGYGGRLDIRPAYQREFVYDEKQQRAVIRTVMRGLPLNVMYWCVKEDGSYEVLDGQQRTLSICNYVQRRKPDGSWTPGALAVDDRFFMNLTRDEQDRMLDYRLMVYVCDGEPSEKLEWFKTVNIAGAKLTDQELRNAVYTGEWLGAQKRRFSKSGCVAAQLGEGLVKGSPIRQELLERTLEWICARDGLSVEQYMAAHQRDLDGSDAFNELWEYYKSVMNWTNDLFARRRPQMKSVEWGLLYNRYHANRYNPVELEETVSRLLADPDVTRKPGVYEYALIDEPTPADERVLSIRAFSESDKTASYERQKGCCVRCGKRFERCEMQADHIVPWARGGRTVADNCQMLCVDCNRGKSDKVRD